MPRMGRIVLPNYPHHVVQRGHNRQVVFALAEDYQRYLTDLRAQRCMGCKGLRLLFDDQPCSFVAGSG
jgi:hypothetical protein